MTTPQRVPTGVEAEVQRLRSLTKEHHFESAVQAARALLVRLPENRDVLYLLALSQRQLRQIPAALATLADLRRHHPRSSLLYQELGHCHVALRDAPKAIEAYEQAVAINPALPATWEMLEGLYRMTGDEGGLRRAAAHRRRLKDMPTEVVAATGLFCEGDLNAAEKLVRAFLLAHGDHVEAMRLLARIGVLREVLDDAEMLLEAALAMQPDYAELRRDYACVLIDRHKYADAAREFDRLLELDPGNVEYKTMRGTAAVGLGQIEAGIVHFEQALRDSVPGSPAAADLELSIAHALKTLGRREEAISAYHRAIALRPNFGDAYWSMANLKTYRFPPDEIATLEAACLNETLAPIDRYHAHFALGKAYEDLGRYEASWRHYESGNAMKRAESRYRPELLELNTRLQKVHCSPGLFEARRGAGNPSQDPIFILGLPRAGSTLLEQILASHSQVEGTQELADIPRMALTLKGYDPDLDNPRYPACLWDLKPEEVYALGRKYIDDTRVFRTTNKPFFLDKMPNNFRHAGLIHLVLPNARIIDARREPMACCFGNLKQLFARGQEFCYSIDDIARYYRTYLELMQHWEQVMPGRLLRVHYEDVVDDLEGSVRRMLDFLELPFEPACLDYHRNVRSVRTASSEQVRQPIYREALDQWRHYEPWLGELRDKLGDALVRYRDPPAGLAGQAGATSAGQGAHA